MASTARFSNLYMINYALLFAHEIGSAFWQEWDLFGIPGGIQVFVILNLGLLLVGLYGFRQILGGARSRNTWSLLLAAAGILAFAIHSYFILAGRREFIVPVSLALLLAILAVSLLQAATTWRQMRAIGRARSPAARYG
jgi:hypothetical protein